MVATFGKVVLLFALFTDCDASLRGGLNQLETPKNQRNLLGLRYIGSNPTTKLSQCQGDCDTDNDCNGNLVCYHKDKGEPGTVPGCTGTDTSRTDWCIDPADLGGSSPVAPSPTPAPVSSPTPAPVSSPTPAPISPTSSTLENFKLKMYWEEGYYWQEERFERQWCMRCRGGSCSLNEKLYIEECDDSGVQRFDFVYINNSEVLIRLHGTNRCLQRDSRDIYVKNCDSSQELQQWMAKTGSFSGEKFEISQNSLSNYCITQRHHPKPDEEVELETCVGARSSDTSLWERCYSNGLCA